MNEDLSRLLDPATNQRLTVDGETLRASSGARYPIVSGIPRFVPPENYAANFGAQWNRFPQTQLDSHIGFGLSEERLSRCLRGQLGSVRGRRVLEAGSGAGRFTEVLLKYGAVLDTFDFSAAVEANALNNGHHKFTLVQADIVQMPFPKESYEFVICLGVLQHTLNTEDSISYLWEMVAPGGALIIDHYAFNLWLSLPPPLGDAEKFYRRCFIHRLRPNRRFDAVKALVDFWFPIYWHWRDSRWARKILSRIAGIHFYYGILPLQSREQHYEWALLDTHDGMTDHFKRYRTLRSIKRTLEGLGAMDIHVWKGGNGIEAWCRKPRNSAASFAG